MSPYIYQYVIGGSVFLVGLIYAARQGYVGFTGRKLASLVVLVRGIAFFRRRSRLLAGSPDGVDAGTALPGRV